LSAIVGPEKWRSSASETIIKVAILAVGGQGGGVLTNWIAELANKGGYAVQATSVAGVAQRTGATIYYLEMAPKSAREPVFAQSPTPGDVDVLIAAELMEAGRGVLRGFVTPNKTTLIASTHRILAVAEKQTPGDSRSDAGLVHQEITAAALKTVCFDMERIAVKAGSVISASLFGGLAKSGALPFPVDLFETVIEGSGRGVEQSLAAFRSAVNYDAVDDVAANPMLKAQPAVHAEVRGPEHLRVEWRNLTKRVEPLAPSVQPLVIAGLCKVVDYQDVQYGTEYLDRVIECYDRDIAEHNYKLTMAAAKTVANAMCYDDIVRVADLKIRFSREQRVRREQQLNDVAMLQVTEYFHPRADEISATLPAAVGAWLQRSPRAFKLLDKLVNRGRRIRSDRLGGFLALWLVSQIKPFRRKLLRHRQETAHINRLTARAMQALTTNYALAVEILNCQRLVKGYSDTHARGHSKLDRIFSALDTISRIDDAAVKLRELREVALADEAGDALDGALEAIGSTRRANHKQS